MIVKISTKRKMKNMIFLFLIAFLVLIVRIGYLQFAEGEFLLTVLYQIGTDFAKTIFGTPQIPIRGHAVDFVAVLPPKWK